MRNKLFFWSLTVALAGFLFGLDTAVISGAEQDIQQLWRLDDFTHGLAVAMALYGTVIGAMFGGIPADRLGRKRTLFWIGVLYLISALGSALAPEVGLFMVFRFVGGLSIGASSVAAPLYISEIAPARSRGRLVALFQFNIVLGILLAYVSNYLLDGIGEHDWRLMLGVVAIPSLIYTVLVMFIPESPRWLLLKKGRVEDARAILQITDPESVDASILAMQESALAEQNQVREPLFSRKYSRPVILAFLFAFFNQWSGINAIIYYAPRIFEDAGLGKSAALLSSAGIGLVNLLFTMLGIALIDRVGRRVLMFVGSVGLIATLGLVSQAFNGTAGNAAYVPVLLFGFIAFFALSQGAVIWVFISEIFPNTVRAAGQALGSCTHWVFAAVIANIFPVLANNPNIGASRIFLFFSIMMVLQLLFVWRMMPETKGVSLEDLSERMTSH